MPSYKAPLADIRFVLEEVLDYPGQIASLEAYKDFDLETAMAILSETAKFCANEMFPLNAVGDAEGLKYDAQAKTVTTPKGTKELYRKYCAQGIPGLSQPVEFGGQGAPHLLNGVINEIQLSCNLAFAMCGGLSHGAMDALLQHASDNLKQAYLPKLVSGEWSGTMCLTEPQCGTDLGLITTKAAPHEDHYHLEGTKIWITFGEHDLNSNIIHLVLARLPDAPAGIKGISLFIVPKFTLDGQRNPIFCGGLEHKMGIHASPTCVMNLEKAKGWLVGQPHKGMQAMFTMMNAARLGVGQQGLGIAEVAYQNALAFARERRQSRSLDRAKQDASAPADPILVHPDVRRMLLNVKSTNEPMRALAYWTAVQYDLAHVHPDPVARAEAIDLVALFTPICKSYLTERGFENASECLQVLGGSGYTRDWGIEQNVRDVRIALIYEGTNHIQALDLVGRKLPVDNGRLYRLFATRMEKFLRKNGDDPALKEFVEPTAKTLGLLNELTMGLASKGMADPEEAAAVASNYLNFFALTSLAWMWCLQVKACVGKDTPFHRAKIKTARYFFSNVLPETRTLGALIKAGKAGMMELAAGEF